MEENMVHCPYCNNTLDKIPNAKSKCPFCKQFIFVLTDPDLKKKVHVTKTQADEIRKKWSERSEINYYVKYFSQFGITNEIFLAKKQLLSEEKGTEVENSEVLEQIFHRLVYTSKDFHELKMLYFSMALIKYQNGEDFFNLLQESMRFELLKKGESKLIKKVKIHAIGCEHCKENDGKIYTIEDALKTMPIPNPECTHEKKEGRGWCRCFYIAEIEGLKHKSGVL